MFGSSRLLSKVFLLFSVLFLSAISVTSQDCKFDKNGIENPPFVWMLNKLESKTVRKIKGKITDGNGEPILGAVVSVFFIGQDAAKFIGSYQTDYNGEFCFGNLKEGKYVVKIGHEHFQRYDLEVKLEPKNRKALKTMEFMLDVGY